MNNVVNGLSQDSGKNSILSEEYASLLVQNLDPNSLNNLITEFITEIKKINSSDQEINKSIYDIEKLLSNSLDEVILRDMFSVIIGDISMLNDNPSNIQIKDTANEFINKIK